MKGTGAETGRGESDVDPFAGQLFGQCGLFEALLFGGIFRFEILRNGVKDFAEFLLFLGREFAEVLADLGEGSFAAEDFDADFFQGLERAGGSEGRKGRAAQIFELSFEHCGGHLLQLGSQLFEEFNEILMAFEQGHVERRLVVIGALVDIGTVGYESLGHGAIA